jgi:hypothetical protein
MYEGRRGEGVRAIEDQQLDISVKRTVDLEYQRRGFDFLRRSVDSEQPFFLYYNHSLMHLPMVARAEFQSKSTNGDWGTAC